MNPELIIISEYCSRSEVELDFIIQLENEGLIEIRIVDGERYLHTSQLKNLEQYARLHYDLSVNIAGIDVIQNLLDKIEELQTEITRLKQHIQLIDLEE